MGKIGDPIREMLDCHKDIVRQLAMLKKALGKFRKDGKIEDMRLSLDGLFLFMKTTLALHTKDEEEALFPFMRVGSHLDGEISLILNDHKDVHASIEVLKLLREMGRESHPEIERRVSGIIEMLGEHVRKEENVIYELAREKLTDGQMAEISRRMNAFRDGGGG
jgi:hemerythrin-like domain-containing protein